MTFSGLTGPASAAHIHGEAPAGAEAPPVITFTDFATGQMDRTFTITKDLGDKIALNPHLYYVNVHTAQFPGGEIRGQLSAIDTVATFFADLRGASEVPPNASAAFGSALVTIHPNNILNFEVNSTGLVSPNAAHIHPGVAGVAMNPIINFTSSTNTFAGGRVRGTVEITAQQAADIKSNPAAFYVNVHTPAFPGGEIRGQLVAASESDIAIAGKVTGVGGENFVTDVRVFNPSHTARASALLEYFQAGGSPNPTATNSIAFDIPPRGMAVLNDVAGTSGVNLPQTVGGVRVTSVSPLVVTSRIYDDRRARNGGTIGQFVPGFARSAHLRRGVLAQLQNNSEARTNIGFFNPNAARVDLRVEMRDAAGVLIGTFTRTLEALTQQQSSIASYFSGFDVSNRAAFSVSFDASAPILAFGSVIDNASSDQIFVSAVPDTGAP